MNTTLIPQELFQSIPDLYETEEVPDSICHMKLFLPNTYWIWYITEISKLDHDICFGYVIGLEKELGYFSLNELKSLQHSLGVRVERDVSFQPTELSKIRTE